MRAIRFCDESCAMIRRFLIAAGLLLGATPALAAAPTITDLVAIDLLPGINRVPAFARDGREATIVQGWVENGNAHGSNLFVVLLPEPERDNQLYVVRVEPPSGATYVAPVPTIRDKPHTGEDSIVSVRFAHGRVNGEPATLLLVATRETGDSLVDPGPATYDVYRLERGEPGRTGTSPDHFMPIPQERPPQLWGNADLALACHFGLPVPADYAGPDPATECPALAR